MRKREKKQARRKIIVQKILSYTSTNTAILHYCHTLFFSLSVIFYHHHLQYIYNCIVFTIMKLRHLESALSDVDVFEEPKVELEQVPTSPHIAARMLYSAMEQEDIDSCMVGDFGVGTGMLVSYIIIMNITYA
jgi:hypothetical protein